MPDERRFVDVDLERCVFAEVVDRCQPVHRRGAAVWLEVHDTQGGTGPRLSLALSAADARALGHRLIEIAGGK
jgi:hypothetical protein